MPETEKRVPELRFKGFIDDWEQRKLGEVGSVVMCKRIFKDQTAAFGDIPFYKIGTFGGSPDSFIPNELFEEYKKNYPYPEIGDILMSASGTIGRIVVYEGEKAYYQDSNIVWLKTDKSLLDNSFLKQFYQVVKWSGLEGSTIKRLYNSNILSTGINLPSLKEQIKIGDFFKKLDGTIALHQEKEEKLRILKKCLLNNFFPNNEEDAPYIRFANFNSAWGQRKLGEISESYSGGTPSVANQSYYGGSIPFIRSAEINSKNTELYLTEVGLVNSSAKLVEEGDILYALYGATSGEVGISQINGAINQAILAIKPKIEYDSNFIMQWLRRQKNSIISTYLQGGQGNLSGAIVKDLNLSAPIDYEEQQKIGSYFKQLDEIIALHQQKVTQMLSLKSTLLNKMFI